MKYLETKIRDVGDPDFQGLVTELCFCVDFPRDDFADQRLSFLLMAIGNEGRVISKQHLHGQEKILTTKVDRLSTDSVLYHLCRELVDLKKTTHIEAFDGKTVLFLIKSCYKFSYPKRSRARKPTRNELRHRFQTESIVQRRNYGEL